ncbi:vesicle-associated protein 1-1 isoform X2 [Brassica napus]|uniref:vesicle-associated protein 1-1 isoform X2 n=1 Tax=Brassica napus TaxID=3708 RepID=UPI0020787205|nr:vesicle-associated protein 1-1 isoform X2 [Brassica napus]
MSNSELLNVEPLDLQFPFELRKQISCSLYLTNKTDNHVAFKVKTTNPKKYCVRPNTGVVLPRSTCEVLVTMQAQKEAPSDMQCKDKFLLQGVIASPGVTAKEVTPEMFSKEAGHLVEETKLRVTYVAPPQPPSPVHEGSEEGSSPRASVSDNGGHASEFSSQRFIAADKVEPQENTSEDQLRRDSKRGQSGMPLMYVLLVGLIGLILGYIMKST